MTDSQTQNATSNEPQDKPLDQTSTAQASSSLPTEPSSSTSQPETSSHDPTPTCAGCAKPVESPKLCPRCHTTAYCSRDCQKADFKKHKKGCAELAQTYAENANFKMAKGASRSVGEGRRGGLQKWQFDT